jgi:hypothetical protein
MPTNIHRLTQIRDAADNMPAVNAIKVLEMLGGEHSEQHSSNSQPGVVIRLVSVSATPAQHTIDVAAVEADETDTSDN